MDLKELLDKYITLTTLNLDRPVMLCANKRTYRYEYFVVEGEKYFLVDDDTRKYLDDNFTNKMPHVRFIEESNINEEYMVANEKELTEMVDLAIKNVAEYFSDVKDVEDSIEKLKDVKVFVSNAAPSTSRAAHYSAIKNEIVLYDEVKLEVLEHEFTHALACVGLDCGFSKGIMSEEHDDMCYYFDFGVALDEAYTQFCVNNINNNKYKYYKSEVCLLENLFLPEDEVVRKQIKKAYVNSNLNEYFNIIKKYYNLNSINSLVSLVMNFDLFLMAEKKQIINKTEIYTNLLVLGAEISGNKNIDISNKGLEKFAKVNKIKTNFVKTVLKVFTQNQSVSLPEMLYAASNVIYDVRRDGETKVVIPKAWKDNGFVLLLMANASLISCSNESLGLPVNQYDILNYIFNFKNKLVNKNNIEQVACTAVLSDFASVSDLKYALGAKFDKLMQCSEKFQDIVLSADGYFMKNEYPEQYEAAKNRNSNLSEEKLV